jgi:hypothetical protein
VNHPTQKLDGVVNFKVHKNRVHFGGCERRIVNARR